jgi:hypothetical protein
MSTPRPTDRAFRGLLALSPLVLLLGDEACACVHRDEKRFYFVGRQIKYFTRVQAQVWRLQRVVVFYQVPGARHLGIWVINQRADKNKFDRGDRSALTLVRVSHLSAIDAIGFTWPQLNLAPNAPLFKKGDKVEADFGGDGDYYSSKVKRARSDDTFDIWYEDGDKETKVPAKRIRRCAALIASKRE